MLQRKLIGVFLYSEKIDSVIRAVSNGTARAFIRNKLGKVVIIRVEENYYDRSSLEITPACFIIDVDGRRWFLQIERGKDF